jgi:arginase
VTVTFLVVPQWQGSGSSRAMRLVDGAHHIQGDLPSSRTVEVPIPLEAGDDLGSGVARLSSLIAVRDAQRESLRAITADPDAWALTVGGDCSVELASVAAVAGSGDVALLWFGAHPALHTPATSRAGTFSTMVLRTLLGEGDERLIPEQPLPAQRVLIVGARAFDDEEADYAGSPQVLSPLDLTPEDLLGALAETGASTVYIHIDLDVLDPADVAGVGQPEPFGIGAAALVELIKAVTPHYRVVGAGVTGFAPASPDQALDDQPTILRIIGALTH